MTDTSDPSIDPVDLPVPGTGSVVGTPMRRPGSVRRTANINTVWPDGPGTSMQMRGRVRDLLTPVEGEPTVLGQASMVVMVAIGRTVESIETTPSSPTAGRLVGARGGSDFRTAIDEAFPGLRVEAAPLHFILDDIAGMSLISGFAWSQAYDPADRPDSAFGLPRILQPAADGVAPPSRPLGPTGEGIGIRKGRIICSGLRPGGYHEIKRKQGEGGHCVRPAGDLSTDDAWAWHELESPPPPGEAMMRRRRRVDVWKDDGTIEVDAHFRDSMWRYDGTEIALHEYEVRVSVDAATHTVKDVAAYPRVLPFPECPWAAPHVTKVIGLPLDSFRTSVQHTLQELDCCTHLNDMLRCLAEAAALSDRIPA